MAKMANGLCDNLLVSFIQAMCNVLESMHRNSKLCLIENYQRVPFLFKGGKMFFTDAFLCVQTCVVRAWDPIKPLLFCPAMNTAMWSHQLTSRHRDQLLGLGYVEVPPVTKMLACGDEGWF
jgi:hypothetical protein